MPARPETGWVACVAGSMGADTAASGAGPRSGGDRCGTHGRGSQPFFFAGAAEVREPPAILLQRPLGKLMKASGWRSFSAVPAQELLAVWQSFLPAAETP